MPAWWPDGANGMQEKGLYGAWDFLQGLITPALLVGIVGRRCLTSHLKGKVVFEGNIYGRR